MCCEHCERLICEGELQTEEAATASDLLEHQAQVQAAVEVVR